MVVAQQSAESLTPVDPTSGGHRWSWTEHFVPAPLVRALFVVVRDELAQRAAQHRLADEDQLPQALALDGVHEPFCERIHVGRLEGREHDVDAGPLQDRPEGGVKLGAHQEVVWVAEALAG